MKIREVTGKAFRVLTDATNDIWSRMSFWTRLSDVHHNDDTTLYSHVSGITGISDSLTSSSTSTVASASCAIALEQQIKSYTKTVITNKVINYTGKDVIFEIPVDGTYKFECYGAAGSDYGSYKGGLGGYACGEKYFTKGTRLVLKVGGSNAYNRGGTGTISFGGGATEVWYEGGGILMSAGGGGGAGAAAGGYGGGTTTRNTTTSTGESTRISYGAGGGGGYHYGGQLGYAILHYHASGGCSSHRENSHGGGFQLVPDGKGGFEGGSCPVCGCMVYGSTGSWTDCPNGTYYTVWDCGKSDGQIDASVPAGGGTNYIEPTWSNQSVADSSNSGNGKIVVNLL